MRGSYQKFHLVGNSPAEGLTINCANHFLYVVNTEGDSASTDLYDLITGTNLGGFEDIFEVNQTGELFAFEEGPGGACVLGACYEEESEIGFIRHFYLSKDRLKGKPWVKVGELKRWYNRPATTGARGIAALAGRWADETTYIVEIPEVIAMSMDKNNPKFKIVCKFNASKSMDCVEK
jgi:hypothetical protein